MKSKQGTSNSDKQIKRIFFSQLPSQYKNIDIAIEAMLSAIKKQKVTSMFDLNYVRLIQDVGEALLPNLPDLLDKSHSSDKHKALLYENRAFLTSLIAEQLQDGDNSPNEKLEMLYYYITLIKTFQEIYLIEVVQDQSGFIAYLEQSYNEQESLAEEFDELIKIIDEDESNIDSLVDFCNYTHEQLETLSEQLFKTDITDSAASFYQVFSNYQQETCNWKYKMTSLMYLISLLFNDKASHEFDDICHHIKGRITIKGKSKRYETLRQTLRNLNEKEKFKGIKMNREYSQIKRIFESTLP